MTFHAGETLHVERARAEKPPLRGVRNLRSPSFLGTVEAYGHGCPARAEAAPSRPEGPRPPGSWDDVSQPEGQARSGSREARQATRRGRLARDAEGSADPCPGAEGAVEAAGGRCSPGRRGAARSGNPRSRPVACGSSPRDVRQHSHHQRRPDRQSLRAIAVARRAAKKARPPGCLD